MNWILFLVEQGLLGGLLYLLDYKSHGQVYFVHYRHLRLCKGRRRRIPIQPIALLAEFRCHDR